MTTTSEREFLKKVANLLIDRMKEHGDIKKAITETKEIVQTQTGADEHKVAYIVTGMAHSLMAITK